MTTETSNAKSKPTAREEQLAAEIKQLKGMVETRDAALKDLHAQNNKLHDQIRNDKYKRWKELHRMVDVFVIPEGSSYER